MDDNSLYDLLKKKAEDPYTKDEVMYREIGKHDEEYTYSEIYILVNKYIDFFSKCNYKNKSLYLIVDNSIKSIVVFIAMLKVGIIPVLINIASFYDYLNFIGKQIICKKNNIDFFDATKYGPYDLNERVYAFEKYINSLNINLDNLVADTESKFGILTSGSTSGKPKIVTIYEKDLLRKDETCFSSIKSEYFCTYIPIGSISSIVYNVLLPLYTNQKIILMRFLEFNRLKNMDVSLLAPRDILDFFNSVYYDENRQYNFSNINKLYLSGEINNLDFIKKMREKMPELKENVFVNLYGSTEALGIISYCEEDNLKPIYINQLALANGDFIYTYDKVNFYKRVFNSNSFQDEKLNFKYDDFIYFECLPVSENKVNNVVIENNFGEIIYNDKRTGDIGIYVNNQLYIICRKTDVIEINNKKYYLTAIENLFSKFTGLTCTAIKYENKIFVIANFILEESSITNIKDIIPLIKKSYDLAYKLSYLPLSLPIFIDSNHLPRNKAMKKIVKNDLITIIENKDKYEYYIDDYERCLIKKVQSIIDNIIDSNVDNVEYQGNNIFRIKKTDTFNIKQLMLFFNQTDIRNIYEKDDYFYFTIADNIIIDAVIKQEWKKLRYIKELCAIYRKSKKEFYDCLNGIEKSDKKYDLIIIGKKEIRNDEVIFRPILINKSEKINLDNYDLSSYDYIYYTVRRDRKENNNLNLTNSKIEEKIKILWNFFNHEYSINHDKDFFIDGVRTEKKRHIVYKKLYTLLTNHVWNSYLEDNKYEKINFSFENFQQLILVLNEKKTNSMKWCRFSLNDFDNYQNEMQVKKDNFLKINDRIEELLENLYIDKNNDPILMISLPKDYTIQNDNYNSILEAIKRDTCNCLLKLIKMLKKHEPVIIKVDGKDTLVNFSNLKVIYMVVDEELYKEPTIDKCIELGYPKEIVNSVDKITSYFGLVHDYKKSKVKRKELK